MKLSRTWNTEVDGTIQERIDYVKEQMGG